MSIELQKIDCNCNDCKFMVRDFDKKKYWESKNELLQIKEFERNKAKGHIRNNAKFQFDKKTNKLQYGKCSKFNKDVVFIPNHCQIETQQCFVHRKD